MLLYSIIIQCQYRYFFVWSRGGSISGLYRATARYRKGKKSNMLVKITIMPLIINYKGAIETKKKKKRIFT